MKRDIMSVCKKGNCGVLILMLLVSMLMQGNTTVFAVSNVIQVDNPEVLPTGVHYQDNQIVIGSEADGGSFILEGSTDINTISIASGVTNLTLILNGVSITSSEQAPIQLSGGGDIILELADDTRNVLDARLADNKAAIGTGNTGRLTITGDSGTLDALGGFNGAGIGGNDGEAGGTITVNGGVITSTGGNQGAGIGGGKYGRSGTIKINGGSITAIGGNQGAGIGGGHAGASDHIVITDGLVKTTGGKNGAGIGGGNQRTGGWIEITGGEIDATGGENGAGIGGGYFAGYFGANGTINISGGRIKAVGGNQGAGIGGGLSSSAGIINISGGTLTAIGSAHASAIGNGMYGQVNNIHISQLATILAQSREADAIGADGTSSGQLIKGKLIVALNETQRTYLKVGNVVMPFESQYAYFAVSGVQPKEVGVYADEACTAKLYDIGTLAGERLIPISENIYDIPTEVDYAPRMIKNNKIVVTSNPTIITTDTIEAKDVFVEDSNLIYKVLDAPEYGQLELVNSPETTITQFSQQDLADRQVCYVYDGGKATSDSFKFSLYDGTTESAIYIANIELNITNYTVTFKDYDGTVLKVESVEKNNSATAPNVGNRIGYSFIGWDQAFDDITSNKTVTAQYKINQYEVTFNSAGGTDVPSITADYNMTIESPIEPTKDNYVFVGWYKDIDFKNLWDFTRDKVPANNMTLYAKWVPTQGSITMTVSPSGIETNANIQQLFVIRINNDTLTKAIDQSDIELSGSIATLTMSEIKALSSTEFSVVLSGNLSNAGIGYITIKPDKLVNRTTDLRSDILIEAKPEYTITYMGNGAEAGNVPVDGSTYHQDDRITILGNINNLYKSGYAFVGWNTQVDGQGSTYNQGDTLTVKGSNMTLYAKWVPTQGSITMTVSPSGIETNANIQQLFVIRINNDTLTEAIDQSDIELSGSIATLTMSEIKALSSTEFSVVLSGNLSNAGIGYITIKPDKLVNRTTDLRGDILIEAKPEYTITYIGNGAEAGNVPVDGSTYHQDDRITILGNINNLYKSGYAFVGWNTQVDGQGSTYNQGDTLTVKGSNMTLYAMWKKNSSGTGSHHNNTSDNTKQNAQVIINGKKRNAGLETVTENAGEKSVDFEVQADVVLSMIEDILNEKKKDGTLDKDDNELQIDIRTKDANQISAKLTGDIIKALEEDAFNISIVTGDINYIIPAKDINIGNLAKEWSVSSDQLDKIEIEVKVVQVDQKSSREIENMARINGYEMLYPPVVFEVIAKGDMISGERKEIMLTSFDNYVQRIIKLPDTIDSNRITTGVVYNEDGSFSHIPTEVFVKENESYARLNSRTNSSYTVIENPTSVPSVRDHWSREAVEDMASRLVIGDSELFLPDKAITRGEFAEYITKALGLYRTGVSVGERYKDIDATDAYAVAIEEASTYGLITGYTDGTFRANDAIDYEEAMVIISRAMDICGLEGSELSSSISYMDLEDTAEWSYKDVSKTLSADLIHRSLDKTIHLKDNMTASEAVVAIRNLLIASHLINE